MKTTLILAFILLLMSFHSRAQQTIDKLNTNQLKLPKESASKALILDATGQVKSSSTVTDTEVGYLDGLTDTILNLLSGKANDADVVKLSPNQTVSGIKTFDGKLITSSTTNGSIPCPGMNQTQRDALTPANGECVYNSTSLKLNIYDGSIWKDVGGAGGISLWATSTGYLVNDVVIQSDKIYICLVAHTSGTFATDLSSAKWKEISKVSTIKSQGVSVSNLDELQIQNNQLTQTGTNKFYIESDNKNILNNPSFEHSTFSTGWTNTAGTFTEETSAVIDGVKAAKVVLSAQTLSLTQSSTLYASQFSSTTGIAAIKIKSDIPLKVCSIQAGVVSTVNCADVLSTNTWSIYSVNFNLGPTSNGISIASVGSVTGTVYVDDAYVGVSTISSSSCPSTLDCTETFSATISSTGAVSGENVDFINGNCSKGGTGIYNCTINSGVFSVVPNLVATIDDGSGTCREVRSVGTNTATSFRVDTLSSAGAATDCQFKVMVNKTGADYTGKTTYAVASDQNIRTPGVAKAVVYSAYIGAAGTVISEIGNLINGNCTVASTNVFTCTFTSGIFASDPVCNITVMGISGASRSAYIVTSPTTSGLTYLTYNTTGPTATALNVQLTCHGVSP